MAIEIWATNLGPLALGLMAERRSVSGFGRRIRSAVRPLPSWLPPVNWTLPVRCAKKKLPELQ